MAYSYARGKTPVWRGVFSCVWLVRCDMTHSYDPFIQVTLLIHVCDSTHSNMYIYIYMWNDLFIYATWLVHVCDSVCTSFTRDETHSYMWYDLFICMTWRLITRDMAHFSLYDSSTCDMTHSSVCYDSSTFMKWLVLTHDMTHSSLHDTSVRDMTHTYM